MSASGGGRGPSVPRRTLSERNRRILALLVREYIERGEPVSSLWLAEHSGLSVSSATVRNVLAALEDHGYVRQPHTSAGRIPTDLGYRGYVDQILEARRPSRPPADIEARLRQAASIEEVLDIASHELSRSSHHLGFVVAPASDTTTLKHVDFVALDASRVLVVLVATNGHASHKVITASEPLGPADLTHAANYINAEFGGHSLGEIRALIAERMNADRALYDRLLKRVLDLASASLENATTQVPLFVHGTPSLVDAAPDEETGLSMSQLRALLTMIEEKHRLIQLLTEYIEGPGLTVVIGGEHLSPELQGFSLVASTYDAGSQTATVGVIGPMRMRYSKALNSVDSVAQILGRVLADTPMPDA